MLKGEPQTSTYIFFILKLSHNLLVKNSNNSNSVTKTYKTQNKEKAFGPVQWTGHETNMWPILLHVMSKIMSGAALDGSQAPNPEKLHKEK